MASKPTFIIVGGAFQTQAYFDSFLALMRNSGHRAYAVAKPSVGNPPKEDSIDADIAATRSLVESEVNTGADVIMVLISAGGVLGSAALDGLGKQPWKPGGVVKIVGISAFFVLPGQNLQEIAADLNVDWWHLNDEDKVMYINPFDHEKSPADALFNNASETIKRKAYDGLAPQGSAATFSPIQYAGWQNIPLTYVVCEQDKIYSPESQRRLISGLGVPVKTYSINAGHDPTVTEPDKLAEILQNIATEHV